MEQLPRLKARIASLDELRNLFHALRALAASHVQEAQAALAGIRQYVGVVEAAIAEGAALLPDRSYLPEPGADGGNSIRLILCSEHGFAGEFNERLFALGLANLAPAQTLAVIGRRGAVLAEESGVKMSRSFSMATHLGGVLRVARRVADDIADADHVDIVFASYRKGGQYEVVRKVVLPLDPSLFERAAGPSPPLAQLAPDVLLKNLAKEYVFAEVTRAVLESFASENGARLRMMENADHNISDKLDMLHGSERVLTQEAITTELFDVVTGAEAILGADRS